MLHWISSTHYITNVLFFNIYIHYYVFFFKVYTRNHVLFFKTFWVADLYFPIWSTVQSTKNLRNLIHIVLVEHYWIAFFRITISQVALTTALFRCLQTLHLSHFRHSYKDAHNILHRIFWRILASQAVTHCPSDSLVTCYPWYLILSTSVSFFRLLLKTQESTICNRPTKKIIIKIGTIGTW